MNRTAAAASVISIFLFSLVAEMSPASGAENSWVTKTSMQVSRTGAGTAAVNGIVYIMGGSQRYNVTGNEFSYRSINATEAYNPMTDVWSQKAPMPTSRDSFGAAAYQNRIFCIGGKSASKIEATNCTGVNEVYDTETNSWETKNPMPTPRYGLQANEVDGKIYLIGGWIQPESSTISESSKKVEIYDPATDTWSNGSQIPIAVAGYSSAIVDGKIYVISGVASGSVKTNLTQVYDPETDKWSSGVPIPMSVSSAAAGAVTGADVAKAIYVIGGSNATYPLNGQFANQVFFPETNSWAAAAPMPVDRAGLALAVINETIFVMGGGHNIFTQDSAVVMQYTPLTNPITQNEPFPIIAVFVATLVVVAVVAICVLIYSKKLKR